MGKPPGPDLILIAMGTPQYAHAYHKKCSRACHAHLRVLYPRITLLFPTVVPEADVEI